MILEKYKVADVLGKGSFGLVKKATNIATDKAYAMKIIDKQTVYCKAPFY